MSSQVVDVYIALYNAIQEGRLIVREGRRDKEFHFQNWVVAQLDQAKIGHTVSGRNSYPDIRLDDSAEGLEVKGLAHPGRVATYDCNSQVPTGYHDNNTIYYVFGRYPSRVSSDEYPVHDLVVCHGDLLNADREYEHENKSVDGFGSYGDLKIRDRKMYVAPTPYALLKGTAGRRTLILPKSMKVKDTRLQIVGRFTRIQHPKRLTAYEFDLTTNELRPTKQRNPDALKQHKFIAYRHAKDKPRKVKPR